MREFIAGLIWSGFALNVYSEASNTYFRFDCIPEISKVTFEIFSADANRYHQTDELLSRLEKRHIYPFYSDRSVFICELPANDSSINVVEMSFSKNYRRDQHSGYVSLKVDGETLFEDVRFDATWEYGQKYGASSFVVYPKLKSGHIKYGANICKDEKTRKCVSTHFFQHLIPKSKVTRKTERPIYNALREKVLNNFK